MRQLTTAGPAASIGARKAPRLVNIYVFIKIEDTDWLPVIGRALRAHTYSSPGSHRVLSSREVVLGRRSLSTRNTNSAFKMTETEARTSLPFAEIHYSRQNKQPTGLMRRLICGLECFGRQQLWAVSDLDARYIAM